MSKDTDWKKEFDKQFVVDTDENGFNIRTIYQNCNAIKIEKFIENLLQQQQEKFLEMIGSDETPIPFIDEEYDPKTGRNKLRQQLREKVKKTC